MLRGAIIFIVSALAAMLQVGLFSGQPWPLPALSLPVILVVVLTSDFRLSDALVAAFGAGLVLDAVSSFPAGTMTVALGVLAVAADILFTRVFSNQTMPAVSGLQTAVFLAWVAEIAFARGVRAGLLGWPWSETVLMQSLPQMAVAVLAQVTLAVLLTVAMRRAGGLLASVVIVARPRRI
jgi:hypothetical protein